VVKQTRVGNVRITIDGRERQADRMPYLGNNDTP
jgi:hypothetical protein